MELRLVVVAMEEMVMAVVAIKEMAMMVFLDSWFICLMLLVMFK